MDNLAVNVAACILHKDPSEVHKIIETYEQILIIQLLSNKKVHTPYGVLVSENNLFKIEEQPQALLSLLSNKQLSQEDIAAFVSRYILS